MVDLILIAVIFGIAGFLLGIAIVWKPKDGTMYFYTDDYDGEKYTFAEFKYGDDIVSKQKCINLKCVKLPKGFDITKLSAYRTEN